MFNSNKLNDEHPGCMMVPPPVSQQFCLKWNDHSFNLVKTFSSMIYDQNFVDVTLACEGSSIKAHKVVLSACSNYFKELFLSNPCKHPIVILKDMKMDDLKAIVDFMYKGEVAVFQHQLGALLKTAEILKVKGLTEVKDDDEDKKLNQDMREMDKENAPVNNEMPRTGVEHTSLLNENECHMNGVSSQPHYQPVTAQPSQPLSSHLVHQQHPIQPITNQHQHQQPQPQQQQPLSLSQNQTLPVHSAAQLQPQTINNIQTHNNTNQSQQPHQQPQQQPPPPPLQKQHHQQATPTSTAPPTQTPTPSPTLTPVPTSTSIPTPTPQSQPPPQLPSITPQSLQSPLPVQLKQDSELSQQLHGNQIVTQQHQLQQQQQSQQQQQQEHQQALPPHHKQPTQARKRRRRRSKRSVDSSSVEEGSGSEEVSGSASGDDDSVSGDNSVSKRLKPPVPPQQGNSSSLDNSNHSLTSRRRQPLTLPPPPPPPVVNAAIQSHRELVNNNDYGHLDDSSETWQDGEQLSMNNPMGDASEESNGMIDIKPIVSFDEGSVGASMNNMSVSSENMIVSHMDYPSLSPGSTGSTPSNTSNTGKICRCQHCGITFTAYSSLRRHMQRHFADRERYVCDICLKSYSRKDYLKEHRKLKHPT